MIVLSLVMEPAVFRPLRTQSPAVMLVDDVRGRVPAAEHRAAHRRRAAQLGEPAASVAPLNAGGHVGGVDVRKVTIVAVVVAVVALGLLALLLARTTIGLQMRAAAADFATARLLGVRANRVIAIAVAARRRDRRGRRRPPDRREPARARPTSRCSDTIIVLVGVVVGGIDRLWTATLGGFSIGFATGVDQRRCCRPTRPSTCRRSCSRS